MNCQNYKVNFISSSFTIYNNSEKHQPVKYILIDGKCIK